MHNKGREGKICVVLTGGTLAMSGSLEEGGAKPSIGVEALVANVGGRLGSIMLDPIGWKNVPSSYLMADDMVQLAHLIEEKATDDNILGFVVLHGTDTLEESAFAVSILTAVRKPIVFTGSMRRHDQTGYDGYSNIQDAIDVVLSKEASARGPLVVFGGSILDAMGAEKFRTASVQAFDDPWMGPCGYCYQGRVRFLRSADCRPGPFPGLTSGVGLLRTYSDMSREAVRAFAAASPAGIVIEAFGIGSVPLSILPVVESLIRDDIPVVIASQTAQGWTAGAYGFPGGGKYLQDAGCIFAGRLSGRKARLLLMAALTAPKCPDLKALFAHYD